MGKRIIRMKGEAMRGTRVQGQLLRDLLDLPIEGSKQVMRLQVEGRSTARGPAPAWLGPASSFEVLGIEEGSTCLSIDAPPLRTVSEEFAQMSMYGGLDCDRSALDYFTDSLRDAAQGEPDSDRYDAALISTFSRLDKLMKQGGVSDRRFELLQENGTIRGVVEEASSQELGTLFGKNVIVSGTAHFRPSGSVLQVDAEKIEEAGDDAKLWASMPQPLLSGQTSLSLHRKQGPRSGVSAIFGQWPGDETDEEIAKALAT